LGSGAGDAKEIKEHPWFAKFDWNAITDNKIMAPFVPKLKFDTDISYFDPEFTETPLFSDPENENKLSSMKSEGGFPDFTYNKSMSGASDKKISPAE